MKSHVYLETENHHGRTRIKDMYFEPPYKFMAPFETNGHIDVIQMAASAGMLSGDNMELELLLHENSDVTYLSQSYEKIFASKGQQTKKNVHITLEKGASLNYLPFPVIPFAGSDFESGTEVRLPKQCRFIYGDIFNCGRVGMGERFQMKCFRSKIRIYLENQLIFADHTLIDPYEFDYTGRGFWENFTHNGLLFCYGQETDSLIKEIRRIDQTKMEIGCSQAISGVVVRILGTSGDQVYKCMKQISELN